MIPTPSTLNPPDGGPVATVTINNVTASNEGRGIYGEPIPPFRSIIYPGMSLRDHFAGLAMQAIIAKTPLHRGKVDEPSSLQEATALGAYSYADAMLRARQPAQKGGA